IRLRQSDRRPRFGAAEVARPRKKERERRPLIFCEICIEREVYVWCGEDREVVVVEDTRVDLAKPDLLSAHVPLHLLGDRLVERDLVEARLRDPDAGCAGSSERVEDSVPDLRRTGGLR